jgi:hypothetical protein
LSLKVQYNAEECERGGVGRFIFTAAAVVVVVKIFKAGSLPRIGGSYL